MSNKPELKISSIKSDTLKSKDPKNLARDFYMNYMTPAMEELVEQDKKKALIFGLTVATVLFGECFINTSDDLGDLDGCLEELRTNVVRMFRLKQAAENVKDESGQGVADIIGESLLNGLKKLKEEIKSGKVPKNFEDFEKKLVDSVADDVIQALTKETGKNEDASSVLESLVKEAKAAFLGDDSKDCYLAVLPTLAKGEHWACSGDCKEVKPKFVMDVKHETKKENIGLLIKSAQFYYTCESGHQLFVHDKDGRVDLGDSYFKNPEDKFKLSYDKLLELRETLSEKIKIAQDNIPEDFNHRVSVATKIGNGRGQEADYTLNEIEALIAMHEALRESDGEFIGYTKDRGQVKFS